MVNAEDRKDQGHSSQKTQTRVDVNPLIEFTGQLLRLHLRLVFVLSVQEIVEIKIQNH